MTKIDDKKSRVDDNVAYEIHVGGNLVVGGDDMAGETSKNTSLKKDVHDSLPIKERFVR